MYKVDKLHMLQVVEVTGHRKQTHRETQHSILTTGIYAER